MTTTVSKGGIIIHEGTKGLITDIKNITATQNSIILNM